MTDSAHSQVVQRQFGEQASAYLSSAVHASGPELEVLSRAVAERPGTSVLDLGCGAGHVSFGVAPFAASVLAYDLSEQMLGVVAAAAAERQLDNVVTRQGAAEQLPFEDASFDFVFSRYSAHHWREPAQALREVRRVLRPDGEAVFIDVVSPAIALYDTYLQAVELLRDTSHVRDYSVSQWHEMAGSAGLLVTGHSMQQLRLDFASWVQRMRTPPLLQKAIRLLQQSVGEETRSHFEILEDGSFTVDVMVLGAKR